MILLKRKEKKKHHDLLMGKSVDDNYDDNNINDKINRKRPMSAMPSRSYNNSSINKSTFKESK